MVEERENILLILLLLNSKFDLKIALIAKNTLTILHKQKSHYGGPFLL